MSYELASSMLKLIFLKFVFKEKCFLGLLLKNGFELLFDPYLHP